MIFFDTNILIYASINQDIKKLEISQRALSGALENESIVLSPLLIQEYVFALKKLRLEPSKIRVRADEFLRHCYYAIDCEIIKSSIEVASRIDYFQNINDIIHLKYAEKYASKLVTFDSDFEKLRQYSNIEIEILQV